MEILGIGTEIIECPRIGKMIEQHGEIFLRRVYTPREIRFCQARKHAIERFAGHWAAKEAILKAMGTAWTPKLPWTEIEVRVSPTGSYKVYLSGNAKHASALRGIGEVMLSIAHCRTYATAYAIAVGSSGANTSADEADVY